MNSKTRQRICFGFGFQPSVDYYCFTLDLPRFVNKLNSSYFRPYPPIVVDVKTVIWKKKSRSVQLEFSLPFSKLSISLNNTI